MLKGLKAKSRELVGMCTISDRHSTKVLKRFPHVQTQICLMDTKKCLQHNLLGCRLTGWRLVCTDVARWSVDDFCRITDTLQMSSSLHFLISSVLTASIDQGEGMKVRCSQGLESDDQIDQDDQDDQDGIRGDVWVLREDGGKEILPWICALVEIQKP